MELANKGKKLLITTAIILLTLELIWIFVDFFIRFNGGVSEYYIVYVREAARIALIRDVFRFILHCLLFAFTYRGHRWAKWATVATIATAIVANLIDLGSSVAPLITLFGLSFIHIMSVYLVAQVFLIPADIFAIYVLLSRPVRAYQNHIKPSAAVSQAPMPYQPRQLPMSYQMAPGSGFAPQYPMTPVAPVAAMTPGTPIPQVPQPDTTWACACGTVNQGRFCSECGQPKPAI